MFSIPMTQDEFNSAKEKLSNSQSVSEHVVKNDDNGTFKTSTSEVKYVFNKLNNSLHLSLKNLRGTFVHTQESLTNHFYDLIGSKPAEKEEPIEVAAKAVLPTQDQVVHPKAVGDTPEQAGLVPEEHKPANPEDHREHSGPTDLNEHTIEPEPGHEPEHKADEFSSADQPG